MESDEAKLDRLLKEIMDTLDGMDDVEYRIDIQARAADDGDYIWGAEESNNWDASWC